MEITRRNLLKAGAAVAVTSTVATAAIAEEAAPAPVATYETDILVLGSGMSGMCAAIQAAEMGAKVVVLDKGPIIGGATNFAEVMLGVGSRMQDEQGLHYTTLEVLQREMAFHNYRVDWNLWARVIELSGETINWFLDIVEPRGGGFMALVGDYGSPLCTHMYKVTDFGEKGAAEIICMTQYATELGVEFKINTPATKILKDESGKVCGAYAEAEEGLVEYKAKAVIVATGGFAGNNEMLAETCRNVSTMSLRGYSIDSGDGIRMCLEAGAGQNGPRTVQLMGAALPLPISMGSHLYQVATHEGFPVWVNQKAKRYIPEGGLIATQAANAVDMQQASFAILDDAMIEYCNAYATPSGSGSYILAGTILDQTRSDLEEFLADEPTIAYKADTVAELAQKIGLDPETLVETIDRYNGFVEAGADGDFGKDPYYLMSLKTPPFYALRMSTNLLCTMGNISIDEDTRVLTPDFEPIVGLYAAGCDAGGFAGETYCVSLPGGTQCMCANTGRLAAMHACKNLL